MPLIDRTERLEIALIDIDRDRRQRREIKTDGLRESMKNIGLIQAIVVERAEGGRAKLMAGERRLTAAKELGTARSWATVCAIELQKAGLIKYEPFSRVVRVQTKNILG